ncbi:MAG: T9SS type A sorting domain-containing protein [Candidatus Limimorpha sp.]
MKKVTISILMVFSVLFLNPFALRAENGTENDPFLINDKADLIAFQQGVNSAASFEYHGGTVNVDAEGQFFKLTADIYFNDMAFDENGGWEGDAEPDIWHAIGFFDEETFEGTYFKGVFDGDGHTIFGLYFNDSNVDNVGLFGEIDDATVKNLRVSNVYFCGKIYVGGIAGMLESDSKITNCVFDGYVRGANKVGGIAGLIWTAEVSQCMNLGTVFATEVGGGLVGFVRENSTIHYCFNAGKAEGTGYIGGICGYLDGSNAELNVSVGVVKGTTNTGAVIGGEIFSTFLECYYDKQLCTSPLGVGNHEETADQGLLTSAVTNGTLLNNANWKEAAGRYPVPSGMVSGGTLEEAVIVASLPVFLSENNPVNGNYETVDCVYSKFSIGTQNDVQWESLAGHLTIQGNEVSFTESNVRDTLVISKNTARKQIALFLDFKPDNVSENQVISVKVFPNPASDVVTVKAQGLQQVTLFNTSGQTLLEGVRQDEVFSIDVRQLAPGAYLLQIVTDDGVAVRKIIKTKG